MASSIEPCGFPRLDDDTVQNNDSLEETTPYPDENTPLSPGEVNIMRNHSGKAPTRLLSSSRKPKGFHVHGDSPQTQSKLVKSGIGCDLQERRKTLQVLQPSAKGNGVLVGSTVIRTEKLPGKERKSKHKATHKKTSGTSSGSESSDSDKSESTDKKTLGNEAFALMVQDPPPERYFQVLAEERRLALAEALEENQRLCKELEEMKERCKNLEEVAGQAEYFASLYAMVMEGETGALDSSENDEDSDKPTDTSTDKSD